MKLWRVGLPALVAVVLLVGCTTTVGARHPVVVTQPTPVLATTPTPETFDYSKLPDSIDRAVNDVVPGTDLGFALYDERTEQTLASIEPDRQFYTASLVKLFIALDNVHADGWHAPSDRMRANLTEMLSASDDGIAAALWEAGGQSAIVTRMVDLIGLTGTRPPTFDDQWEMTRTTAGDLVRFYRFLTEQVPVEAAEPIVSALNAAQDSAADGFPQYFGIPDGLPDTQWAVKQGWMTIRRAVVLNSTGLVDSRYVVVLLAELPLGTSYARGREALTAGAAALAPAVAG